MNWQKSTTQDYRRGWTEGEAGERNIYRLEDGATNIEEYNRGFADAIAKADLEELLDG